MKKYLCILYLIFFVNNAFAQDTDARIDRPVFPNDYEGTWNGILKILKPSGLINEVNVSITWQSTEEPLIWDYHLIYSTEATEDIRRYRILRDSEESHIFHIDERNSIYLKMFNLGDKLISTFSVEGNMVHFIYTLQGEEILMEVFSHSESPMEITGGTEGVPLVKSFRHNTYQTARLRRKT